VSVYIKPQMIFALNLDKEWLGKQLSISDGGSDEKNSVGRSGSTGLGNGGAGGG
jgi:hypothetical protein